MSAHTPGPWHLNCDKPYMWEIETGNETDDDGESYQRSIVCIQPLDDVYPDYVFFQDGRDAYVQDRQLNETDKANARLIAAAPDLLTALLMVLDDLNALDGRPKIAAYARAAIVKATGEA